MADTLIILATLDSYEENKIVNMAVFSDHISLKVDQQEKTNVEDPEFDVYVMDLSYFSGKLEAYMRYQDFRFRRLEPVLTELRDIKAETGTAQVPLVFDRKRSQWLRDTTYIIEYMEKEHKNVSIIPQCPVQAFFSFLLEDFSDEYMWRPAMYYRWEPSFDSTQVSTRFTYDFYDAPGIQKYLPRRLAGPGLLFRQWLFSVFGEGLETEEQHAVVKSQYLVVLQTLQNILDKTPFLLGNQPTLVDFGFMGPFFRHFSSDPTGRKIMQQTAPAVFEWVARMWNCKHHRFTSSFNSSAQPGDLPESWNPLFPLVREYLEYLVDNARAWKEKKTSFMFYYKGGLSQGSQCQVQTVEYRVWCRQELQRRFEETKKKNPEAAVRIQSLLRKHGCWDALWVEGVVECPPELGVTPPFCQPCQGFSLIDSPKWPMEHLLLRYFKEKMLSKLLFILALLPFAYFLLRILTF